MTPAQLNGCRQHWSHQNQLLWCGIQCLQPVAQNGRSARMHNPTIARTHNHLKTRRTNHQARLQAIKQASKLFCSSPLNPCSEVLVHLHKAADDAMTLRVLIRVPFPQAEQRRQTSSPRCIAVWSNVHRDEDGVVGMVWFGCPGVSSATLSCQRMSDGVDNGCASQLFGRFPDHCVIS